MHAFFSQLTTWITSFIESSGYIGIAILIALENIFPPLPSELILPLTGYLVSQQKLWFPGVLLASTLGSVLGALLLYYVSSKLGQKHIYNLAAHYGVFLGLGKNEITKSFKWFDKHGTKTVFFGRLIPTIRSVVSVPAGLTDMEIKKFILYTALGSGLWNAALISFGWALGEQWSKVQEYTKFLEYGVLIFIVGFICWIIYKKHSTLHRKK